MRSVKGFTLAGLLVLVFPASVFAVGLDSSSFLYSSDILAPLDINIVQDIGLILPVVVAWFAIRVARLMQGGKFERIWKLIAAGMGVLAIIKVVDGLENLGVLYVVGLRNLLEFVMIVVFFTAFLYGYRSLMLAIRGPSIEKPVITVPKEELGQSGAEEKPAKEGEPQETLPAESEKKTPTKDQKNKDKTK